MVAFLSRGTLSISDTRRDVQSGHELVLYQRLKIASKGLKTDASCQIVLLSVDLDRDSEHRRGAELEDVIKTEIRNLEVIQFEKIDIEVHSTWWPRYIRLQSKVWKHLYWKTVLQQRGREETSKETLSIKILGRVTKKAF